MDTTLKRPNKGTHGNRILCYLETHHGITSLEAIQLFGNTRLSATIFSLRKLGYNIISVDKECKNRYGEKTTVTEYQLIDPREHKPHVKIGGLF